MNWHTRTTKDDYPTESGWYRVMVSGDSESIDGHEIYSYPDYETWAHFTVADPSELEDLEGGFRGTFVGIHVEEGNTIFAFYGPFVIPTYERS